MLKRIRKMKNKGQATMEYALVIGVICVGVIFAGRAIFGSKDSLAEDLMRNAVNEASKTLTDPNGG